MDPLLAFYTGGIDDFHRYSAQEAQWCDVKLVKFSTMMFFWHGAMRAGEEHGSREERRLLAICAFALGNTSTLSPEMS